MSLQVALLKLQSCNTHEEVLVSFHLEWGYSRINVMWTETLQFSLFCDKVIEVTGEVRRKINCFTIKIPKLKHLGFLNPPSGFVNLKTTWGRATFIKPLSPNPSPRTGFSTVKHASWKTSPRHLSVPKYLYQKRQHSSEKTKELLWRLEWTDATWTANPLPPAWIRHLNLERTCRRVGFCSMMRTSSVSM